MLPRCKFVLRSPLACFALPSMRGLVGRVTRLPNRLVFIRRFGTASAFPSRCVWLEGKCGRLDGRGVVRVGAIHRTRQAARGGGRCTGGFGDHVWPCLTLGIRPHSAWWEFPDPYEGEERSVTYATASKYGWGAIGSLERPAASRATR